MVQQAEDSQRAGNGHQVEIGHAATEQRVLLAQVVVDIQAGHHRAVKFAGLVHLEELGNDLPRGLGAIIPAAKRDLRQRVLQNPGGTG